MADFREIASTALALARAVNGVVSLPGGNLAIGIAEQAVGLIDIAVPVIEANGGDERAAALIKARDELRASIRAAARAEADALKG